MKTLKERFDEKWIEDKKTGCWEWQTGKSKGGYGKFSIGAKSMYAHRVSYVIYKGEDPGELCVCHKCDNPGCVNPDCMFLGTHKDNVDDCVRKGRRSSYSGEVHYKAKMTEEAARATKLLCKKHPNRRKDTSQGLLAFISRWFNVPHECVRDVACGKSWKHVKV